MTKKLRAITFSVLALITLFIAISYLAGNQKKQSPTPTQTKQAEKASVNFVLDFGNKERFETVYKLKGERSVYDALVDIAENEGIDIETQMYDFGVFVKKINGRESTAEHAWIYFVNGEAGQVAADQLKLKDGDTVEWRYIKPN